MNLNYTTHSMRRRSSTDHREFSHGLRGNPRPRAPDPAISFTVGQLKVMLDSDLARLYGVETKAPN
jgi:hypothetical protein